MAIISENIEINGHLLVRHKSDCGRYIKQKETGIEYAEALDKIPCRFTYEEIEKEILPFDK